MIEKGLISEDVVLEQLAKAKSQEIEFWGEILKEDVLGFRLDTVKEFISYLVGHRSKSIGIQFPLSAPKNPFKYLDTQNDFNKNSVKGNFFDSSSITYAMSSQLEGWSDF
jgi:ribonucleotide reductase beta subunit family protein with ferritin-like domain